VFGLAPAEWHARILSLPFLLLAILGLAALSRRWVEEPMIRLARRITC
jgi:peptidoglycan/LPS O-acetylase OafA/YrhL